ncbi:MAG: Verru Chthon cassette protein [Verrucomicrobiaceae bacterium]|nr:Verru Chthon cassette protein [Verrucomicrobiaceae bacterium]
MKHHHSFRFRRSSRAFSLVETVLALGIMALAITALLGLLPHGIEMTRKAANAAAETRIVDSIVGQLSNMPFTTLPAQDKKVLHFDDQGVVVDNTSDIIESTYLARVLVSQVVGGLLLPGSNNGEAQMLRVQIQIIQTPLRQFNFDTAPSKSFTTVPVVLAPMAP